MESIVSVFHLDVRLFLAQVINFALVFAVLYFFALKPLMKVMAERTAKIEKGLTDAQDFENKLAQAGVDYDQKIVEAVKEAKEIINNAQAQGELKRQAEVEKTKVEIKNIIQEEKERLAQEKSEMMLEVKKYASELVVFSLEKVLADNATSSIKAEMIDEAIKKYQQK